MSSHISSKDLDLVNCCTVTSITTIYSSVSLPKSKSCGFNFCSTRLALARNDAKNQISGYYLRLQISILVKLNSLTYLVCYRPLNSICPIVRGHPLVSCGRPRAEVRLLFPVV